ncbi:MAG: hypothetical protein AB8F74_04690 [Saprospiraceae bacterium]
MALSKRHRYKNRREKYNQSMRNLRMLAIFGGLALVVLIYKNRVWIYDWITIWFM